MHGGRARGVQTRFWWEREGWWEKACLITPWSVALRMLTTDREEGDEQRRRRRRGVSPRAHLPFSGRHEAGTLEAWGARAVSESAGGPTSLSEGSAPACRLSGAAEPAAKPTSGSHQSGRREVLPVATGTVPKTEHQQPSAGSPARANQRQPQPDSPAAAPTTMMTEEWGTTASTFSKPPS